MNVTRPRRLDLNAPLLSTRRPFTTTTTTITNIEISRSNSLCGSCNRVPFSWEQSPGKPKDIGKNDESEDKTLPLPKPPPIRWLEESTFVYDNNCNVDVNIDVDIDGIDNNEDEFEDEDEDEDDSFSDAIDLFSLAESLNLSDKKERGNTRENEDLESEISGNNGSSSPNFMIQKFLPAATALAASSLSALATSTHQEVISTSAKKKHIISVYPRNKTNRSCVPRKARQTYPSSRGCGLEMFFPWPWRAKHKLCGVKSPVRNAHSSLKQQLSTSNK